MRIADLVASLQDATVVDAGAEPRRLAGPVTGPTLLVLTARPADLPVGRLVDLVCAAQADVAGVVVLDEPDRASVVVLVPRAAQSAQVRTLAGRGPVLLQGDAAHRAGVEAALLAQTQREQVLALRAVLARERAAAAEQIATLRAEVAKVTASYSALRRSRTYALGQALQEARRTPVTGFVRLPGALRRAGKDSPPR